MNADGFLLDTLALLTLIEDEAGADRVEQVLAKSEVWLPWLTLLEATYITRTASRLKAGHHLSLADAIIAAFAIQRNAVLLHKDPEFEALAGQVALEALPYKSS